MYPDFPAPYLRDYGHVHGNQWVLRGTMHGVAGVVSLLLLQGLSKLPRHMRQVVGIFNFLEIGYVAQVVTEG